MAEKLPKDMSIVTIEIKLTKDRDEMQNQYYVVSLVLNFRQACIVCKQRISNKIRSKERQKKLKLVFRSNHYSVSVDVKLMLFSSVV